jgi:hypothetical protein
VPAHVGPAEREPIAADDAMGQRPLRSHHEAQAVRRRRAPAPRRARAVDPNPGEHARQVELVRLPGRRDARLEEATVECLPVQTGDLPGQRVDGGGSHEDGGGEQDGVAPAAAMHDAAKRRAE